MTAPKTADPSTRELECARDAAREELREALRDIALIGEVSGRWGTEHQHPPSIFAALRELRTAACQAADRFTTATSRLRTIKATANGAIERVERSR